MLRLSHIFTIQMVVNGKDQERKTKLTDQNYFIQRILNKDKRFATSPAYIYMLQWPTLRKNNCNETSIFLELGERELRIMMVG